MERRHCALCGLVLDLYQHRVETHRFVGGTCHPGLPMALPEESPLPRVAAEGSCGYRSLCERTLSLFSVKLRHGVGFSIYGPAQQPHSFIPRLLEASKYNVLSTEFNQYPHPFRGSSPSDEVLPSCDLALRAGWAWAQRLPYDSPWQRAWGLVSQITPVN